MKEEREWAFDPEAAVAEAKGEKEFREALQNLPMPEGTVRLSVSAAKAAAPQVEDLLEQARNLQNRGQLDLAEKLLEQARLQDPKNQRVRGGIGSFGRGEGGFESGLGTVAEFDSRK